MIISLSKSLETNEILYKRWYNVQRYVNFYKAGETMAILGIDLGTTNSLGAVYRNNKVELIPNRYGSFLTPSVVSMDGDKVLVGQVAKERLVTHPLFTAASFKKDMGTKAKYWLGSQFFTPEELSSFVVRSIVDDAREYLQEEIEEVIISVPAYFHDKQRVATKKAGVLAGVPVKRIINEPSAAAMASYFEEGKEQLFLVFDFGGGTLDVSIVECFDTMVEIISVAGDNRLGGDNFHEIMMENFIKEHGINEKKVSDKEKAILIRKAEECKRALTTEESANMTAIIGGQSYTSVYTNQRLLDESGLLLARIKDVLAHALRDGGVAVNEIDAVVMVGGSSKMPLIQSYLQHLMKKTPFVTENCDEMIVRGLGLVCAVKARNEEVKDYVLTDICPFTLGTGTHNETSPEHAYMCAIIPRNTVLPCSIVKRLYTVHDNQTRVGIDIAQGEHAYVKDNILLDEMKVAVPRNKKGEEAVDVRYTYDINGILVVDVTVVSTGKTYTKVVSEEMTEEELERKMKELEALKVHPKDIDENRLIMERLHAAYESASLDMKEYVLNYIRQFEAILETQNLRRIKKARQHLELIIPQFEDFDPFASAFEFEDLEDEDDIFGEDDEQEESEENYEEDNRFTYENGEKKWTS